MVQQPNARSVADLDGYHEDRLNQIEAQINIMHAELMESRAHVTPCKVDELLADVKDMLLREKGLLQSHSIELVKMTSQFHELKDQRIKDLAVQDQLVSEIKELQSAITYLKGRVAAVSVEVYSDHNKSPGKSRAGATHASRRQEGPVRAAGVPSFKYENLFDDTMPSTATLVERCNAAGCNLEIVAEQMLLEQKPKLIEGLMNIVACYEYLSLDSVKVTDEPKPKKK